MNPGAQRHPISQQITAGVFIQHRLVFDELPLKFGCYVRYDALILNDLGHIWIGFNDWPWLALLFKKSR